MPQSNNTEFFSVFPARSESKRAVFPPPIRLMQRVSRDAKTSSAISVAPPGPCGMTLITPGGKPASSAISAMINPAEMGANSDGLTTTVLPPTNGERTALQARILAPFQGVKLATPPSGRLILIEYAPGTSDCRTSPLGRYNQLAA